MKGIHPAFAALSAALFFSLSASGLTTLEFETYPDGTPIEDGAVITTQFASWGVTFVDAPTVHKAGTVLTAGLSLNEGEFPPSSGSNVLAEYEGIGLKGTFSVPIALVGADFTYNWPIRLVGLGSAGEQLGYVDSAFDSNVASSLNPPNERLLLSGLGGISSFEVWFRSVPGAVVPQDGAFAMDHLFFAAVPTNVVPESNLTWVCGVTILGLGLARWRMGVARK